MIGSEVEKKRGTGRNRIEQANIRKLFVLIDNLHPVLIGFVILLADILSRAQVAVDAVGAATTVHDGHSFSRDELC